MTSRIAPASAICSFFIDSLSTNGSTALSYFAALFMSRCLVCRNDFFVLEHNSALHRAIFGSNLIFEDAHGGGNVREEGNC